MTDINEIMDRIQILTKRIDELEEALKKEKDMINDEYIMFQVFK